MRGKFTILVGMIALTLSLSGCSSSIQSSASGANQLSVTGQAAVETASAGIPSAGGISDLVTRPQAVNPAFVRSAPESIPPFPLVLNRAVQHYVDQYLNQPQGLRRAFYRSRPYMTEMLSVLRDRGLPNDLIYLAFAESGFSSTGAGPWQLSRRTARSYGLNVNKWVDERRDPIKSTRAAADYLTELHSQTDGNWAMTLVAWNNGENGVDRYAELSDASYDRMMSHLPRRTRALMNRFMAVALIAHDREYGLQPITTDAPPDYRMIAVKGGIPLQTIALREHTSVERLRMLNPALLSEHTPPTYNAYLLRVPATAVIEASL